MTTLRSILLVEDNPDDERLTLRALRRGNITNPVIVAHNGEEALQRLGAMHPLPIVVFLDLKLPKVDGLEVLRQIRSREATQNLPIVVLTSSSEERDIFNSYHLGANSYVRKPVSMDEFTTAVERLGMYWTQINQVSSYL
ncbi:response regulator [Phormidium sp. FACHB-1136]|jgi:two-component system response regulator|uniref:response regulator n=1 Tax=Phormidium sp. FACHB-1136 TaxID=2692848 RepID=UPI001682EB87|nr:response regulator [Phormidium sp. FACHB-1136]MBD2425693.1 response regulator [Phormidium sp. FACHB-1136]